jgi:CRISPR/Cas system CSM-associated protein Csm4 (group 5 of RAMP superfamily)
MVVPAKKEEYEKGENLVNKSKTIKKVKNISQIRFAELIKKTLNVDIEVCPKCGGKMKIIAFITSHKEVQRYLRGENSHSILPGLHQLVVHLNIIYSRSSMELMRSTLTNIPSNSNPPQC